MSRLKPKLSLSKFSIPAFPRNHKPLVSKLPLWFLFILLLFIFGYWKAVQSESLSVIFFAVAKGLSVTLFVAGISFASAIMLGLFVGIMRTSRVYLLSQAAMFYIEIMRGLPILVVLYYIAFVLAPVLVSVINVLATPLLALGIVEPLSIREFGFLWRGIIALVFAYSAFIAEIFRAGIESIDNGQIEAAKSLGFTKLRMFLPIVFPQAFRNVLPALTNELIAIIKDSSLVSVLGVADITLIGKVYAASTFKFAETYNIAALLYLSLTVTLSLLVKLIEKKISHNSKNFSQH